MNENDLIDTSNMDSINNEIITPTPKSSVKLIKNTKGINWEIKIVSGEESIMDSIKDKAIEIHKLMEKEFEVLKWQIKKR